MTNVGRLRDRAHPVKAGLAIAIVLGAALGCERRDEAASVPAAGSARERASSPEVDPASIRAAPRPPDASAQSGDAERSAAGDAEALPETSTAEEEIGEILDADHEGDGLDELIRAASDAADPRVREAAVVALGDSEDSRALDALVAATEDADRDVVLAAIDQLRWSDDRLAEDAILRLVDSPDPEIARAAREGLDE